MQRIEFRAMNCQMLAVIDSDESAATTALAEVPGWFERWEQCFSRFRADSDLSQLNQRSGEWVPVCADLFSVIEAVLWAAHISDGLVSPTLLAALERAGYDRSFEQLASNQPIYSDATAGKTMAAHWREIQVDADAMRVFLPAGTRLDLGGVAKGWAAEQAAARLCSLGATLVDAGGDIAMRGDIATQGCRDNNEPWPIAIADPFHPDEILDTVLIRGGSVATSGRDYRRWRIIGSGADTRIWQHHILDPRTGQPANTDVLSATVIAPQMVWAEAAAKTALILGSAEGMAWIEGHPDLAATLVLDDGQVLRSRHMKDYTGETWN